MFTVKVGGYLSLVPTSYVGWSLNICKFLYESIIWVYRFSFFINTNYYTAKQRTSKKLFINSSSYIAVLSLLFLLLQRFAALSFYRHISSLLTKNILLVFNLITRSVFKIIQFLRHL